MRARFTIVSVFISGAVLTLAGPGCGRGTGELSSTESALVDNNEEVSDVEEEVESAVEDALSGAEPTDEGSIMLMANDPTSLVVTNAGKFFKPAGCLTTTVNNLVATSVFNNCTGPLGRVTLNGTVTSTFTKAPSQLTVVHASTGFTMEKGGKVATLTFTNTLVYTRSGTVTTRMRTSTASGTLLSGKSLNHSATFTLTYDSTNKCVTRNGNASTTVGSNTFARTVTNYEHCLGALRCPKSGTFALSSTTPPLTLSVEFDGSNKVEITRPDGTSVTRSLLCISN